ncbi:MAG: ComEA family DNA-binding protein [Lachnospiraceae bacterium]|nr:ComEA family DNA-binding protein [Lachnospiraceae bacterium]
MRYEKRAKVFLSTVCIFLCCVLSGCSLSFCGWTLGKKEELTLVCGENFSDKVTTDIWISEEAETDTVVIEDTGKVNLNTATLEELMTLNGIGKTRAQAILEYRDQYGSFAAVEDIMLIPGIKEGIFSKIRENITVH